MKSVTYKEFLSLALPFVLSTVTQPLLGAVDTAVVGRLDSPDYIGGVAIGSVIFNTLYWLFGFLRVATSGFASRSLGENRSEDLCYAWLRPLLTAALAGLAFIFCRQIIIKGAMALYAADQAVSGHALTYFNILIWGAPLVLIGYVNLGWLMGRSHVREVLILQIGTNSLNILLDLFFVPCLHLGVAGVAWATLIAQSAGFILGLRLILRRLPLNRLRKHLNGVLEAGAMKKMAMVNSDLFIRTACLLAMTNIFVAKGSAMGADFLAANAILFQIQYLIAYLFDGLSNAASVYGGKFSGANDIQGFLETRSIAHVCLLGLGLLLICGLCLFKTPFLYLFTDIAPVLAICSSHLFYLILFIPAMGPGLVYAGFFIGATCSAPIRNSMALALAVFILLEIVLIPKFENHGLWTAFIAFCAVRSLVLVFSWNRLIKENFPPTEPEPC